MPAGSGGVGWSPCSVCSPDSRTAEVACPGLGLLGGCRLPDELFSFCGAASRVCLPKVVKNLELLQDPRRSLCCRGVLSTEGQGLGGLDCADR